MKNTTKILFMTVVGFLVLSGTWAVALNTDMNVVSSTSIKENVESRMYTHTVFIEVGTAQWCPPCATWNDNIYNTYNLGTYDFEYVEMIYDDHSSNILNTLAYNWLVLYGISSIPTSICDGNYRNIVGNLPAQLPGVLDACGQRSVKDIEGELSVEWMGSGTIKIDIQITNHESTQYNGYIRVPITEIISRYDTNSGTRYHHGFLDYAFPMNTVISVAPGGTYTNSVTWIGSQHQDNLGQNFGNIVSENIKVMMGVFNQNTGYVDETIAATPGGGGSNQQPNTPRYPEPSNQSTNVLTNADLSWTGGDPDNDQVTYDIYFGTVSPPVKIISNQSLESYDPGQLINLTTYYWRIVAWDEHGLSTAGPLWSFITSSNYAPNKPTITGPPSGKSGRQYDYKFVATDSNGDQVFYYIDWGDGINSGWVGPYASGQEQTVSHIWENKNTYLIKAKTKDVSGAESDWTTLSVTMPQSIAFTALFHRWWFEQFLCSFPVLKHLLNQ